MRLCAFRAGDHAGLGRIHGDSILPLRGADVGAAFAGTPPPLPAPLVPLAEAELLAPLHPRTVFGVGHNYREHAAEMGIAAPATPTVFLMPPGAVTGPAGPVPHPPYTERLDYEAELAVVIGRRARGLAPEEALGAVFGYTIADDVSARDRQKDEPQWLRAKGGDGLLPIGPWVVTAEEIPDPQALAIRSFVNGEPRQDSSTALMVHTVADLVSWLSHQLTLMPGDLIATGTPAGVGTAMDPPRYLRPGDVVRIEIDGIGAIEHPVAAT